LLNLSFSTKSYQQWVFLPYLFDFVRFAPPFPPLSLFFFHPFQTGVYAVREGFFFGGFFFCVGWSFGGGFWCFFYVFLRFFSYF